MKKTIKQALSEATEKLKKSKIPTSNLDAELLLAYVLKRTREYLLTHPEQNLQSTLVTSYQLLVTRRSRHEPIAYITGRKEFYGLNFKVTKDTLIPRPETELLVDEALGLLNSTPLSQDHEDQMLHSTLCNKITIIDIGTGSGNIIISLAKNIRELKLPEEIRLFAVDSSKKALEIAKQNAQQHEVLKNISFLSGRFFNPLLDNFSTTIQKSSFIILANLPYLSKDIYDSSPISVKNFEPKEALLSGHDGLDHYCKLLNQIEMLVAECKINITALLEISPEQKPLIIRKIKSQMQNVKITLKKDLAGKWRMLKVSIN